MSATTFSLRQLKKSAYRCWAKSYNNHNLVFRLLYNYYRNHCLPRKLAELKDKQVIKVLFVVSELGPWKTEPLYLAMLQHSKFEPLLMVTGSIYYPHSDDTVKQYCTEKGYLYIELHKGETIQSRIHPDIIFYQKPYREIPKKYWVRHNVKSLLCFVPYGFHNEGADWAFNLPFHNYCWQQFYENSSIATEFGHRMYNHGTNIKSTGLPMTDAFIVPIQDIPNVWKPQEKEKKRIIWAPHHSILESDELHYGTFLQYFDFMLDMAKKYQEQVQWAFKPHPSLHFKLIDIWGKEKTDAYYKQWNEMDNSQLENGAYVSLFRHSDAMIHDCSGFSIEYQFCHNPVMYLVKSENHAKGLNHFSRRAFNLHYKGHNREEIEQFIMNVINGVDPMKEERLKFYNECLLPPNGKTACQNIIDSILDGIRQ